MNRCNACNCIIPADGTEEADWADLCDFCETERLCEEHERAEAPWMYWGQGDGCYCRYDAEPLDGGSL